MHLQASILVVDDDPAIRFFLAEILSNDGHQVTAVASGEAALVQIVQHEFDLALLDLKLNGVGGIAVLAALRQRWPDTVVIILTAHASLDTAVEALRQGAHDYLLKPCKAADLRASIVRGLFKREQAVQERGRVTQEANLPAAGHPWPATDGRFWKQGGLVVDFTRRLVVLNGNLLELSPTEFDLLAYLANEMPRIVPAQELVRAVQEYEADPDQASNLIRYHIYHIRRKIKEAAGDPNLIQTKRSIGYSLDENLLASTARQPIP
jgi:DNA-binding response OmpR family regulator